MMKLTDFFFVALLSICGLTVGHALEAPFPSREKPFAVKDSGVEVPHEYGGPVKWMDNDRVIFTALRKDVPKNYAPEGLRIVIWDTAKNMITPYADGKLRCYNDGKIAYQTEATKYISRGVAIEKGKIGEMGKEQLVELGASDPNWLFNPYSCNSYRSLGYSTWDEIHRPTLGMHILRLHEDHGYLDLYTNKRKWVETDPKSIREVTGLPFVPENKYRIKYYRSGLPLIELNSVVGGITSPVFSKYANAYVLDQLIPDRRSVEASQPHQFPDGPPTVRLLTPEGKLTTIKYPDNLYNDSKKRAQKINVTRSGLVIGLPTQSFRPMLGDTGMLLVRGDKVIKIMDGQVPDLDVSPDGCKIAFPNGELSNGSYPFTIKIINVCAGAN